MAVSHRIITTNTVLSAALLLALFAATFVGFVELAPERDLGEVSVAPALTVGVEPPGRVERAPRVFGLEPPADPALCQLTADQVLRHFEPLSRGERVELHTAGIAGLVGAYIDMRCANAIHEGDWDVTAQILGVGVIYEVLRPQAEVYVPTLTWDPRAEALVPAATSTFDVLSPSTMCAEALRQGSEPNAFTPLVPVCRAAF